MTEKVYRVGIDKVLTYDVKTVCKNCNFLQTVEVPKGTLAERYIKGEQCDNCGCCELKVSK